MKNKQVRFKRVFVTFDEIARARLCESSGSEHSAAAAAEESSANLSGLVDSFLDRDYGVEEDFCEDAESDEESNRNESESYCTDFEMKKTLLSLIGSEEDGGGVRRMIRAEMESACRSSGSGSTDGFKRRVMSWLRHKGFDAGLCKSRWEKTSRSPPGEHEYIDIIVAGTGTRYIVEISPAVQFTIARPTDPYASLLEVLPQILICKEDELTMVAKLMCTAMRQSLKKREMAVPPWRRNAYLQAKWFGSYKRTTNLLPAPKASSGTGGWAGKSLIGFETSQASRIHCGGQVAGKVDFGLRAGNLSAALSGMY
ncbi:hypothetical protein U1Q18_001153 [Sarracenia purpurea var. burkii]